MPPEILSDPPSKESKSNVKASSDSSISYRDLLVPIDFSEHSQLTIEHATRLAAFTGANIKVLHVFQIPDFSAGFYQGLYIENELVKTHLERAKAEAKAQLSQITDQIQARGLQAEPVLRVGNPYEEITNAAKELGTDLIVIGSHGRGGLTRLLLGSTAERVIQYALCPVLVVKQ
jgi:nucleotide-binding universal stress UspA family protein